MLEDTCDVAGCTLIPAKKILFKGLGLNPFSEHQMEICGKHYLEFLTLMWDRSKAKVLSNLLIRKEAERLPCQP